MQELVFKKLRRFFFHYNKPLTQQVGEVRMSVHIDGQCHFARTVRCTAAIETKENKTQPRLVMRGFASKVTITPTEILIS